MVSHSKLALITLISLFSLVGVGRALKLNPQVFRFEFDRSRLGKVVDPLLEGQEGVFGVYIENLSRGEKYGHLEAESFPAASLYKLYLLASVFEGVEEGGWKMEDKLSASRSYLRQALGSEDFGYEDAPRIVEYTVEEAVARVARISDNYAAIMLADRLAQPCKASPCEANTKLNRLARSLGADKTLFGEGLPQTSPLDIGRFFKALWEGRVVSKEVSEKILNLLAQSRLNDRIPARLPNVCSPEDVMYNRNEGCLKVAHKTGELPRVRHDAGIVYLASPDVPLRGYVIVLMGKDLRYEDEAVEVMAKISKAVYDYWSAKK